jgi:hypothetical protein
MPASSTTGVVILSRSCVYPLARTLPDAIVGKITFLDLILSPTLAFSRIPVGPITMADVVTRQHVSAPVLEPTHANVLRQIYLIRTGMEEVVLGFSAINFLINVVSTRLVKFSLSLPHRPDVSALTVTIRRQMMESIAFRNQLIV